MPTGYDLEQHSYILNTELESREVLSQDTNKLPIIAYVSPLLEVQNKTFKLILRSRKEKPPGSALKILRGHYPTKYRLANQ